MYSVYKTLKKIVKSCRYFFLKHKLIKHKFFGTLLYLLYGFIYYLLYIYIYIIHCIPSIYLFKNKKFRFIYYN